MLLRSFPDFPYQPCFHDVRGTRMAVADEGSGDGPPLVLLHGNPTWSYLWRKVIPVLAPARELRDPERGWQLTAVDDVFFRDTIPRGIPGLSPAELAAYRAPHEDPASRRPLLQWVAELPIEGEPADVTATVGQYLNWLRTTLVPVLLATVTPGAIIGEATAQSLTALPHVTRVHLGDGGHFVPDQHGTALGHAIRGWLSDHR